MLSVLGVANAAITVDLTTVDASGPIGDAIFVQINPQSTGTGVIDSFEQVSGSGNKVETEAYNTTVNKTLDNGSANNFNHSIFLGDIPIVDVGGTNYLQFLLDVNENSGGGDEFISLDEVQIFVGGTENYDIETFGNVHGAGTLDHDGDLVYRMDEGMDNTVLLDYSLNSGSGSGDMFMYVLAELFEDYEDGDVVTLYSHFGGLGVVGDRNYNVSDGFEEWAILLPEGTPDPDVPEPASMLVWGLLGMIGAGAYCRKRMKKA
jgi:hypothetical protein